MHRRTAVPLAPCRVAVIPALTSCCATAMDEDPAILSDIIRQRLMSCLSQLASWSEPSRASFCARYDNELSRARYLSEPG
jgi:hypothetical protein